ncbi:MAG: S-layer homology domain-containing protein, partial [Dethiobacteria bacterium]
MFKKTLTLFMATMLLALLVSPVAFAADEEAKVSLYLTRITVSPGDSVTASGTADANTWVSIKILDNEEIVFFDATKSDSGGRYSLTFKVPFVEEGTLTVVAGYGDNVATKDLTVTKKPIETKDITLVEELADIEVAYGTAQENIGLPANVDVTLEDDSKVSVAVYWNDVTPAYDRNKAGEYTFMGTLVNLPQDITNTQNLPATVKVIVKSKDTTPGGGGGGGGGSPAPVDGTEIKIDKGGKVSEHDAVVEVPAGAFAKDLRVKIAKVADVNGLPLPKGGWLVSDVLEITKDEKGNFTKPVTITMTFDKSKVDSKALIALYYYDPSAKMWIKLDNIKVDWVKGTVSGEVSHFTKFAAIAVTPEEEPEPPEPPVSPTLIDIAGHWAEANIKALVEKGAIAGYPDQTFKPNNNITRAEFATVLVKAFQLEPKTGKVFNDTAGHWAKDAIATANAYGIIKGYSDENFGPNDNITREQMAVMIVKAAQLPETTDAPAFSDSAKIADWAQQAVAAASASGTINGYPDNT